MLAERAAQSAAEKSEIDRCITVQVLAHPSYLQASCVFCYVSTPQEIDTHELLCRTLADGKALCVPLCGARGVMTARRIRSLDELREGKYGIPEPDAAAEEIPPEQIGLIIIPALACDMQGYRLGYGGGYYDRFLSHANAVRMALCAEARLLPVLPREPFDERCDYIITERQVLHTDEKQ